MPSCHRHTNHFLFAMPEQEHNMCEYDETYASYRIEVPEYYNFGFDAVDAWARCAVPNASLT